jgi:hypothetical protein
MVAFGPDPFPDALRARIRVENLRRKPPHFGGRKGAPNSGGKPPGQIDASNFRFTSPDGLAPPIPTRPSKSAISWRRCRAKSLRFHNPEAAKMTEPKSRLRIAPWPEVWTRQSFCRPDGQ